jgi:hypothetical protein
LAEDFNDFGSYRRQLEDEEFQSRSVIRKIFSFRALKFAVKWFFYALIFMVFALLIWRIFSSKLPKAASKLIWTENMYSAYQEYGDDLLIYTQDVGKAYDKDGKFSPHALYYIPAAKEMQLTIRYNKSTLDKLAQELTDAAMEKMANELTEQARTELGGAFTDKDIVTPDTLGDRFTEDDVITAEELPQMPFAFKLRDNFGNIYTEYSYTTFTKDRYVYVRISFYDVDVFNIKKSSPTLNLPTPEVSNPDYIYKGAFAAEYLKSPVETIYIDSYYAGDALNEAFAEPITIYRSARDTTVYSYDKPKGVTEGLISVDSIARASSVREE